MELGGGGIGGRRGLDEARDGLLEGVGGEPGLDSFLTAGEGLPVRDDGVVCEAGPDDVSWRRLLDCSCGSSDDVSWRRLLDCSCGSSDDVSWRLMGKGREEEMDASGCGATGALVEEGLRGDGVGLGELGLGQRGSGVLPGVGEDADRGVDLPREEGHGGVVDGEAMLRGVGRALEEGPEEGRGVGLVGGGGDRVVHDEEDGCRVGDEVEMGGRERRRAAAGLVVVVEEGEEGLLGQEHGGGEDPVVAQDLAQTLDLAAVFVVGFVVGKRLGSRLATDVLQGRRAEAYEGRGEQLELQRGQAPVEIEAY